MADTSSGKDATCPPSVSRKAVRRALDDAEREFHWCWSQIRAATDGGGADAEGRDILDFQTRLFDALAALEDRHHAIRAAEKRLIKRKRDLDSSWFARRMKRLASYRKLIEHGLAIGRAIGDGFAWIFYERERDWLTWHMKEERQRFLPTGVGREGERSTMTRMQGFGGKFLLHHGTTTFLRLGDVSLIDPVAQRVVCIGEVKTRLDGEQLHVSISFAAGDPAMVPAGMSDTPDYEPPPLEPAWQAKLDRQRKRMGDAVSAIFKPTVDRQLVQEGGYHHEVLRDLVTRSHRRHFEYARAGSGLLLAAVRHTRARTLGGRLLEQGKDINALLKGLEGQVSALAIPGCPYNMMQVGTTAGDPASLITRREAIPFLWWPLGRDVMEDLLFERVLVVGFYNPAHLWRHIEARGFELSWQKRPFRINSAVRKVGTKRIHLENLEWFHSLVAHSFVTEETVLAMIDRLINEAALIDGALPARVELHPWLTLRTREGHERQASGASGPRTSD